MPLSCRCISLFRAVAPVFLAVAWNASAAAPRTKANVEGVRHWSLGEITRVAIETNGENRFRVERLSNPDRIFFDLKLARTLSGQRIHVIEVHDRLVKQLRVAETRPGVARVVFDLSSSADYTTSWLANPDRLIIELRPSGESPVAMSKGTPARETATGAVRTYAPQFSASKADAAKPALFEPPAGMPARTAFGQPAAELLSPELPGASAVAAARSTPVALPSSTAAPAALKVAERVTTSSVREASTTARAAEAAALAAKLTTTGERSLTRALGLKVGRVVLDAGHGGHDAGSSGPTGLREKDLVLDVTKRLGGLIEQRLGSEVVYTRSDDTFVPLETRTALANAQRADLFLSIHANSSRAKTASGVETYYLNFTSSREALDVAARENAGSQRNVHELKDLVRQIALHDKVDESREFAGKLQSAMTGQVRGRGQDRGVKRAPFVVLIGASMPSVLAEVGFISNPREEKLMRQPEYRQKLAEALFKGVAQYMGTLSRFQVAQRTP